MAHSRRNSELLETLSDYDRVVEVGIGRRTDVAAALADCGVDVIATDVHDRKSPANVRFVPDNVVDPNLDLYADADAIYALNLPPELHRPTLDIAREADADFLFTTLGGDQPAVPVERRTVDAGTLYVARSMGRAGEQT